MSKSFITTLGLTGAAILFWYVLFIGMQAQAAAPSGLHATQAVATTTVVGPQNKVTVFAANDRCTARIIRTQSEPVYLIFADPTNGDLASTTFSGTAGFFQGASTTVAYDAGIYGCGRFVGYAVASTTISISEMR